MATGIPAPSPDHGTATDGTPLPFTLLADVDRLATRPLWPNYDPRVLPVAIYDGQQTWLCRHPNPPPEFTPSDTHPGALAYTGLHAAIRANTSVTLNGSGTATVMLGASRRTLPELAALVIHELFHVFQRGRHPDWTANEAVLFVYPMDDAELLALRRLETAALRRARGATTADGQAGWAVAALTLRRERFARMPPEAAAYERGNEINEGLACYVEGQALGDADADTVLAGDFTADGVRLRTYAVGRAFALLLDRLAPGWQQDLEDGETRPLDVLLAAALDRLGAVPAVVAPAERSQALAQAQADVADLRTGRARRRSDFLALPGWQLVVTAPAGQPLWPKAFDPLNVQHLGQGEVLHTRFLQLGNADATLDVLGHQALTAAAGAHPLFQGVRTVTVAGLPEQPLVRTAADDTMELTAPGVTATFRGAQVEMAPRRVVITIPGNPQG